MPICGLPSFNPALVTIIEPIPPGSEERITDDGQTRITDDSEIRIID
jgi:hypothetical protein